MSGNGVPLPILLGDSRSRRGKLSESPDIVLCLLQTVQEGEESVTGFVATRRSIRLGAESRRLADVTS